ncbi:16S rRNA (uracil(1498)-N(3))-methyltransferase [Desulfogranum marinum]|uniref:16S rRNA (uracil(1498)-N(3))-methyltransferase n=1 Tax=Desulfogranum marinum TaxID=453220 RepID=UPI0029C70EEA|nr:16S rRNA (uracil(1498)-N(3))-methyltransferase [Desulfogranum marinum]
MNLLIFEDDELLGRRLILSGRRARHLLKVLRVEPGHTVRVGMVNGPVGSGLVITLGANTVTLEVTLEQKPVCDLHVELILALPRPIMLQRILKQATVLGVRRFYLIRSRRVEKSFFQSPVLAAEKIRELLVEGMEQGMDTWLPEVSIHKQFKPFAQEVLPQVEGTGIIAHPRVETPLAGLDVPGKERKPLLLAVGPEGGWNDFELDMFADQGFIPFTMGNRILHVDTATVALLAQLQLLYDLQNL